ncbi:MAG: TIGR02117 family protein [Rikenellaceae bacterium]|jgi:uncharacterized protein (TIGR02117 family)|nr:TIGR02117 family protein [Rikenellaceae bacterium]
MPSALKKILRIAAITVAAIVVFAGLYFGAAWCCSRIAVPAGIRKTPRPIAIWIRTNGAHTDIVVPVRDTLTGLDWSGEIHFAHTISQDTTYTHVGLGWGDQGFFLDMPTWDDLTLRLAFNAAFWLNKTAMHATFYHPWDLAENARCHRIQLSRDQYTRLAEFIRERFSTDPSGHFIPIETTAQYGDNDCFYEARGRYNLFYTCNTWANCALGAAGQRRCLWTIFDTPIFRLYE